MAETKEFEEKAKKVNKPKNNIIKELLEYVKNIAIVVGIIKPSANSLTLLLFFSSLCLNAKPIRNNKYSTKNAPAKLGSRKTENILYICSSHPR